MTVVEKRSNSRKAGSTSCEAETWTLGQRLAQGGGDPALVVGVPEGEQQADRDRLGLAAAELADQPLDLLVGQLLDHARRRPIRSAASKRSSRLDQRRRPAAARVVEARPVLAADLEQVGEAAGRDQRGPRAALLEQRVGSHRHPVGEPLDVAGLRPGALEHLLDRGDHPAGLVVGRARDLGRVQALAVEQRGVGEGPADVDAQEHAGEPTRRRATAAPAARGAAPQALTRLRQVDCSTLRARPRGTSKVSSRCLCEGQ